MKTYHEGKVINYEVDWERRNAVVNGRWVCWEDFLKFILCLGCDFEINKSQLMEDFKVIQVYKTDQKLKGGDNL